MWLIVTEAWSLGSCRTSILLLGTIATVGLLTEAAAKSLLTLAAKSLLLTVGAKLRLTVSLSAVATVGLRLGIAISSSELLMRLLDSVAGDLRGISIAWLWCSVDGLWRSVNGLSRTVDGLHAVWAGLTVDNRLLSRRSRETVLLLSLSFAHLTEEANRSIFLGSAVVEATNEAKVHGFEQRMVMNVGTLTPLFLLNVLLGRGPIIVGDYVVLGLFLPFADAILVGLSKGSIDAGCEFIVCRTIYSNFNIPIIVDLIITWESFVQACGSISKSAINDVTLISENVNSSFVTL